MGLPLIGIITNHKTEYIRSPGLNPSVPLTKFNVSRETSLSLIRRVLIIREIAFQLILEVLAGGIGILVTRRFFLDHPIFAILVNLESPRFAVENPVLGVGVAAVDCAFDADETQLEFVMPLCQWLQVVHGFISKIGGPLSIRGGVLYVLIVLIENFLWVIIRTVVLILLHVRILRRFIGPGRIDAPIPRAFI